MPDDSLGAPVDAFPEDSDGARPADVEEGFVPEPNVAEPESAAWLAGADEETVKYAAGKKWENPADAIKSARSAEAEMQRLRNENTALEQRAREVEEYATRARGEQPDQPAAAQDWDGQYQQAMSQIDEMYDAGKIDGAEAGKLRSQVNVGYLSRREEQMLSRVGEMMDSRVGPIGQRLSRADIDQVVDTYHATHPELSPGAPDRLKELRNSGLSEEAYEELMSSPVAVHVAYGLEAAARLRAEAAEKRKAPETLNGGSRGRGPSIDAAEEIRKRIRGEGSRVNDGF